MDNWRVLAQEIYSVFEDGRKLITVFAPTGFGKTMSSPFLLSLARKGGLASRLIHIVPTRALLRQIYREKFTNICQELDIEVAYQSADRIPESSKSPYFLADLVVTTLESFLLNVYKLPPSELTKILEGVSEGHYYPSFAAIASSIVVMDEAHMYLGDSEGEKPEVLVASALAALYQINVPVILESATMPTLLLNNIVEKVNLRKEDVGVIYVCPDEFKCPQVRMLESLGFNIKLLRVGPLSSPIWATRVIRDLSEAVEEARKLCQEKLVLFVLNSVDRAIEVYRILKNFCNSVLIHSRLTENDKEVALNLMTNNLRSSRKGLIVASPVIEVGVEVDADVLITEPAPLENLTQRAGRLCRGRKECSEATVLVVGDSSLRGPYNESLTSLTINELSRVGRVEWRLLWSSISGDTYVDILENIASTHLDVYSVSTSKVFESIIRQDARPLDVIWDWNFLVSKFRSFSLTKVLIGRSKDIKYLEEGNYIIIDLPLLRRFEDKCLDKVKYLGGMKLVLAVVIKTPDRIEVRECTSEALFRALHQSGASLNYVRYLRRELRECLSGDEYVIDYFIVAKPECYEQGVGLYAA